MSCATGRKVTLAHYRCRVKHGRKGRCGGVLGYRCAEGTRRSISTEYNVARDLQARDPQGDLHLSSTSTKAKARQAGEPVVVAQQVRRERLGELARDVVDVLVHEDAAHTGKQNRALHWKLVQVDHLAARRPSSRAAAAAASPRRRSARAARTPPGAPVRPRSPRSTQSVSRSGT